MGLARSGAYRAKKSSDPLAQLLASGALRSVVLYFATHPEETPTLRALGRATGFGPASLTTEIARLVQLGVLLRQPNNREVRLVLQRQHPVWLALVQLVRAAASPTDVLRSALATVPGIADAFVYGSVASGVARPNSDVDVLIIGTPDEAILARRTIEAGVLLDREVNPLTVAPADWRARRASSRPFDRSLTTGPKAWLVREGVPVRPGDGARSHKRPSAKSK